MTRLFSKSVLGAELFAFNDGYDVGYTITHTIQELFGRRIDLTLYTNSPSFMVYVCNSLKEQSQDYNLIFLLYVRAMKERGYPI